MKAPMPPVPSQRALDIAKTLLDHLSETVVEEVWSDEDATDADIAWARDLGDRAVSLGWEALEAAEEDTP